MVFAFVCYSTMTSDLGNFVWSYFETNIIEKLLATSCLLLALLWQLSNWLIFGLEFAALNSQEQLTCAAPRSISFQAHCAPHWIKNLDLARAGGDIPLPKPSLGRSEETSRILRRTVFRSLRQY